METIICPECNCQIQKGEMFCSNCGTRIESTSKDSGRKSREEEREEKDDDDTSIHHKYKPKWNNWWWIMVALLFLIRFKPVKEGIQELIQSLFQKSPKGTVEEQQKKLNVNEATKRRFFKNRLLEDDSFYNYLEKKRKKEILNR